MNIVIEHGLSITCKETNDIQTIFKKSKTAACCYQTPLYFSGVDFVVCPRETCFALTLKEIKKYLLPEWRCEPNVFKVEVALLLKMTLHLICLFSSIKSKLFLILLAKTKFCPKTSPMEMIYKEPIAYPRLWFFKWILWLLCLCCSLP